MNKSDNRELAFSFLLGTLRLCGDQEVHANSATR